MMTETTQNIKVEDFQDFYSLDIVDFPNRSKKFDIIFNEMGKEIVDQRFNERVLWDDLRDTIRDNKKHELTIEDNPDGTSNFCISYYKDNGDLLCKDIVVVVPTDMKHRITISLKGQELKVK